MCSYVYLSAKGANDDPRLIQATEGWRPGNPSGLYWFPDHHRIETSYDYNTSPPTQWTDAITVDTVDRLLIGDERDVRLLQKL